MACPAILTSTKFLGTTLAHIDCQAHCFLIKHGHHSVVARLNLSGEKDLLTILSGREETVRILDELIAQSGSKPATWMNQLLERV